MKIKYNPQKIEKKWQKKWLDEKIHKASEKTKKPKYYQLETFPYPSAAGLHVGHPKGYIAEDIHARFMRMKGREVLYTMGWDAFGLPTENYAIKVGKAPQEVARGNIKNFKKQLRMFGLSYDWDREINTSAPSYYKWTQWLFIQLFKKGLAYRAKAKVNWCPKDQTVLANEQVIDSKCERCGAVIEQREMEQWFLRITDYADRLLNDLKGLDWPEATIKRQEDWIGRSEGALIKFNVRTSDVRTSKKLLTSDVNIFTTRPDTLFGATYLVLAPEHELVKSLKLKVKNWDEVEKYIEAASHKTELMRQEGAKEKTGVELKGVKAINPATKEEIPIWVADYVLASYGTGAIMAVPAYDERDFEFAKKFNLSIIDKPLVEKEKIIKQVGGEKVIKYKLRDWSVSRQRYWGVPIPMIHCGKCGVIPVSEEDLPVELPELEDYRPKGKPPLASSEDFINVKCLQCGGAAKRDSETLDTFVDSSWYYLAYTMQGISNFQFPISNYKEIINYWLPVDLYVIGAEHTVLHLLYSRFITKFLFDEGYLNFKEPFLKLRHLGLIQGADGQKMSKSKGNVVNPDPLVKQWGADAVRLYEMFMGPFEDGQPWDPRGVVGTYRFINKIWNLVNTKLQNPNDKQNSNPKVQKLLHQTIKKVTKDIEGFKFNTAISSLMILINKLELGAWNLEFTEKLIKLIFPFAPHISQELWEVIGEKTLLDYESWPTWDEKLIQDEDFELIIQVNGKLRGTVLAPKNISQQEAEELAKSQDSVKKWLDEQKIKKIIFVKDRLINFIL